MFDCVKRENRLLADDGCDTRPQAAQQGVSVQVRGLLPLVWIKSPVATGIEWLPTSGTSPNSHVRRPKKSGC